MGRQGSTRWATIAGSCRDPGKVLKTCAHRYIFSFALMTIKSIKSAHKVMTQGNSNASILHNSRSKAREGPIFSSETSKT